MVREKRKERERDNNFAFFAFFADKKLLTNMWATIAYFKRHSRLKPLLQRSYKRFSLIEAQVTPVYLRALCG